MNSLLIAIIPAFISAGVSILVCILNNNKQIAIIETKLDYLSKTIEKHSDLNDRMIILENEIKNIKEDIKHG